MVDKLTPRLGLPEPFLTNPLKVDVGRLQQALEMIDANAVMLTDWDITADGWQKMGTIKGLAQGKIAASLMVVTGTGFANILFQTGDGTVTTVGDPARMTVSAQTSLGANAPTILGGLVVETAADEYEIWFNIAIGTSPRKWSGLLITGNGATIDWTHAMGTQPSDGVELQISRALTSFDVASDTRTDIGTLLSTGHLGSGVVQLDYLDTVDLKGRLWKTGELVRIKKADATNDKGFPPALVSADPSATGWFIRCLSINDTRTVKEFEFTSESAGIIRAYKARLSGTTWSVAKVYTSLDKPTANDISALGMRAPVTGTVVVDLNDMYGPDYYGATPIKSTASAVAANNYPFDEVGTVLVLPFGDTFSCTQLYVTQSGRVAARSYDGSTWTTWRKQANSGVNDDITQLTALSGPLRLGGDAVGDYDAVTMRQLRSVSGGAGGPSMNGVMNYGVGDFHLRDSRAYIQPYEVVADGQLLNRADWPELWAYAQMLTPISDAEWLADKFKRGRYSTGNGTTTFRVPDRNGVQTGSIQALFGRGDGGNSSSNGVVSESGAPNITYAAPHTMVTLASLPSQVATNGAFQSITSGDAPAAVGSGSRFIQTNFDASRCSAVYGRSAAEIVPRNFVGVWVIRASGGFVAANTSWSVINGDAVKPATGTLVRGGSVKSEYKIGTNVAYQAFLQAYGKIDGSSSECGAIVSNGVQEWSFNQNGSLSFPDSVTQIETQRSDGALTVNAYLRPKDLVAQPLNSVGVSAHERNAMRMVNFNQATPGYVSYFSGDWYDGNYIFGGVRGGSTALERAQISINNGAGQAADFRFFPDGTATAGNWFSTSDERVKTNIQRISDPLGKMRLIKGVTWERLDKSEKPNGIGFIAQDVEGVFPDAVRPLKYSSTELKDGTIVEDIKSVDTYGVAAALHHEAILALLDRIEVLEAKLKDK